MRQTKPTSQKALKNWQRLHQKMLDGTIVEGYVLKERKGGATVRIHGIKTFASEHQFSLTSRFDPEIYLGRTLEFKINEVNLKFRV